MFFLVFAAFLVVSVTFPWFQEPRLLDPGATRLDTFLVAIRYPNSWMIYTRKSHGLIYG